MVVAIADKAGADLIVELCRQAFPQFLIRTASEGPEALMKVKNEPPTEIILNDELPKLPGRKIVQRVLDNAKSTRAGILFFSPFPEEELFVDEVVTGQV